MAKHPVSRLFVCTILSALVACSEKRIPVSLEFVAKWDGEPLSCTSDGLAKLFGQADLDDGIRTDCSSGPSEGDCAGSIEALGLTFDGRLNQHVQRVIGDFQ